MTVKKTWLVVAILLSVIFTISPVSAETLGPTNSTVIEQSASQGDTDISVGGSDETVGQTTSTNSTTSGNAINPVSPAEFTGKVNSLVEQAHAAGKPLMIRISQVVMVFVAFMLVLSIFLGGKMLKKAIFVVFCIGLGIFVYVNAQTLTEYMVYLSDYFGGN